MCHSRQKRFNWPSTTSRRSTRRDLPSTVARGRMLGTSICRLASGFMRSARGRRLNAKLLRRAVTHRTRRDQASYSESTEGIGYRDQVALSRSRIRQPRSPTVTTWMPVAISKTRAEAGVRFSPGRAGPAYYRLKDRSALQAFIWEAGASSLQTPI